MKLFAKILATLALAIPFLGHADTMRIGQNPANSITSTITMLDDIPLVMGSGSDARLVWDTSDANANAFVLGLPAGDAVNVPALILGLTSGIVGVDLGALAGTTHPTFAIMDASTMHAFSMSHNGTDARISATSGDMMISTSGGTSLRPESDDGAALGESGTEWADLFLNTGGAINWEAGDVTVTHSANKLAFAGVTGTYSFDDEIEINQAAAGASLDLNTTAATYTDGDGIIDVNRSGALTGVDDEEIIDVWVGGSFTLTEPSSGSVSYYTGVFSTEDISVTAGDGTSVVAALQLAVSGDADIGNEYALLIDGDDASIGLGEGASGVTDVVMQYDTADANANMFKVGLPAGDATNVPIFGIGIAGTVIGADLGLGDGITAPTFAALSADGNSALLLAHNNTYANIISTAGDLLLHIAGANLAPSADDGAALGISGQEFSDLFLNTGGVINFEAGDVTATHAANALTFAGASSGYRFNDGDILGAIAQDGAYGLDLDLASGVFTVQCGDAACSASNKGYVRMQSTTSGDKVSLGVTAVGTFSDRNGTSDLTAISFGLTETVDWNEDIPFFLYVVNRGNSDLDGSDGSSVFAISRSPIMVTSPASANNIHDTGDTAASETENDIFILDDVTVANYVSLPVQLIGAFRMQWDTDTADDWAIQALNDADGVGPDALRRTFATTWTYPISQNGATSGSRLQAATDVPTWATAANINYFYTISSDGWVDVHFDTANAGNATAGSNAEDIQITFPNKSSSEQYGATNSSYLFAGRTSVNANPSGNPDDLAVITMVGGVYSRKISSPPGFGSIESNDFSHAGDDLLLNFRYKAFDSVP